MFILCNSQHIHRSFGGDAKILVWLLDRTKICINLMDFSLSVVSLRLWVRIHRPYFGALFRCEGELSAIKGENPLCAEAVNAAVDRL